MTREVSVGRVSAPRFIPYLNEVDGRGWMVGARDVRFSDGSEALHCTYSFETEAEAEAFASGMRGKMI